MVLLYAIFGIGFTIFIVVMMLKASTRLIELFIGSKHADADEILQTRRIPTSWCIKTPKKGAPSRRRITKRKALRRLWRVIKYFKRTPLVDTEETRARIIRDLGNVYRAWSEADLSSIMPFGIPLNGDKHRRNREQIDE